MWEITLMVLKGKSTVYYLQGFIKIALRGNLPQAFDSIIPL